MKNKNRKRDRNKRRAAHSQQPQISDASSLIVPFFNIGGLSPAEIKAARQMPDPHCVSCDLQKTPCLAIAWRSANGTPYVAAFCWGCVGDPESREPYEIEMKIDCAIFGREAKKVEVAK